MTEPIRLPLGGVAGNLGVVVTIDRLPDECAICHRGITPQYMAGAFLKEPKPIDDVGGSVQLVFQCPDNKCRAFFFGNYAGVLQGRMGDPWFFFRSIGPTFPRPDARFSPEIDTLSKRFVRIYWEAGFAEGFKLTEVAGPGYRKALEVLVKDFAVSQNPRKKKATIEKVPLAQCINNYIDDRNVQECADRAAWLGNDETHYVRVWSDNDIDDLKTLIRLTANWITNTLLTRKYVKAMPRKARSKKGKNP